MIPLSQRVDRSTVRATFLPLPKGKKRGRAVGFCGGDPIASLQGAGNDAPPFLWGSGKAQQIGFQDLKKLVPSGTSATQLAGFWYTPKHDERALVWTRTAGGAMSGADLHPVGWQKSSALACDGGQQVGFGYKKFAKDPSRALLWTGSSESVVVLTGPDADVSSVAKGVSGGVQVGTVATNSRFQRACLWRGAAESFLDLHPPKLMGSDAVGVGDGQQVGHVWGDTMQQRAALWSGSPESYVDLAPNGFARSTAWRCARGFQVGWAETKETGMSAHAMLWGGSANDFIDLQEFLAAPWNVSQAVHLDVDGDTLRILGTARQAVLSNGYEMNAAEQPVMWEMKLLIAEAAAKREMPIAVQSASATVVSDEEKVEQVANALGRALVENDHKAAHQLLAPWLQKQVTSKQLQTVLRKQLLDDVLATDFVVSGNESTLGDLRGHYREYYKDDATRTLTSVESFGEWGPPSVHVDDAITSANFRQWMALELTPDEGSMLDYCLRLWLIVVEVDGRFCIGHLEPGD
jgi:hypothetical protein